MAQMMRRISNSLKGARAATGVKGNLDIQIILLGRKTNPNYQDDKKIIGL